MSDKRPSKTPSRSGRKGNDTPRAKKPFKRDGRTQDETPREAKKPFKRRGGEHGEKTFGRKPRHGDAAPAERQPRDEKKPFKRRDGAPNPRPHKGRGRGEGETAPPRNRDDNRDRKPIDRDRPTRDGTKKFERRDRSEKQADRSPPGEKPFDKKYAPKPPSYLDTYKKPKHSFFRAENQPGEKKPAKPATSKSGKTVLVAKKAAPASPAPSDTHSRQGKTNAGNATGATPRHAETAQKPLRLAKRIADAGICSRRDAERMIEEGRVTVNDIRIDTPATLVTPKDYVRVDGELIARAAGAARLFLYHKPRGELTATKDPEGRPTLFDNLPKNLPRLISIGRLDLDSEGLILLTNSGALSRQLELPSSHIPRTYRVRILGTLQPENIEKLAQGVTVEGIAYGPITARPETRTTDGRNTWVEVTLHEGKNREIRRVFEALGHSVSRLIRHGYGPFTLGRLPRGTLMEIKPREWYKALAPFIDLSSLNPEA